MSTNHFQAIVVTPDGKADTVQWTPDADKPTYRHLQDYVGGQTSVIPLARDMDAWVNDDGAVLGLSTNLYATFLVAYLSGKPLRRSLVGSVVFTGGADADGETLPLTDEAVELFHQAVGCLRELVSA